MLERGGYKGAKRARLRIIRAMLMNAMCLPMRDSRDFRPSNALRPRPRKIWDWMRNNSVGQDPQVGIQLKAVLPIYVLVLVYVMARVYIIVEDILGLRSLPLSCYKTPDWQQFIPHLG